MPGIRNLRLERIVAGASAALLVFMSGDFLFRDLRLANITHAAEGVREGVALDAHAIRQFSAHAGLRRAAADCRGVGASAALQLAALDFLPADADAALQEELLERARETLSSELACSPFDGVAWLAYGRILMDLQDPSGKAFAALERSARTAPAEAPVLLARLWYLQWLYAAGFGEIAHLLAADLDIAMRHLDTRTLAWLYAQAEASVKQSYRDALEAVPPPRRGAVEREFARIEQAATN